MLKTRDYDLWSMRMEQYLSYTDYALWEVIINNDSHVPEPLDVAIPDEHLLKFHSIKDAESLWEAIKTRFGGNKESKKMHKTILMQQCENFVASRSEGLDKIYGSINETVNDAHDIPTAGSKKQPSTSSYVDDINTDDLEEMDLKWQVAMIIMRVKIFIKKTWRNLNFNGKEPVGLDKIRVECYNCHRRGHFAKECHALRNQGNRSDDNERRVVLVETPTSALVVQDELGGYDWSYQAEEGPIDFTLMAHSSDLANSSNTETVLGYDSQLSKIEIPEYEIFEAASGSSVSEIYEDNRQAKDRYNVEIGYHVVPPPYTGNYMPPRADLSFPGLDDSVLKFKISKPSAASTSATRPKVNTVVIRPNVNAKSSYFKPHSPKRRHFNQKSTAKTKTFSRKINLAEEKKENAIKFSTCWIWRPKGKLIDHTSKDCGSYTLKRFNYVDPNGRLKIKGFFYSGCSRHMTGSKSFLTEYQKIDGGFVAFRGSPKGGKTTRKGIKREFSVARTPQQNEVAERKNRTLIEAARTMMADSLLPTSFWADVVNTTCYVKNKVLVTKPHNKTPYELLIGRSLNLKFRRPFGCPVTILNTLDHLGKFDGKTDEWFLVGYSVNSKAFRVFNSRTRKVEENLHVNFLENKPNVAGSGPEWLFDIDSLTKSMNYELVTAGNQSNGN
nr:retrovirus-related Pol polyprotein from transposon TNT 1-94 [Tanacetum cinerariifolium]